MSSHIIQLQYASILMCALCCAAPAAVASSNQVELKWSELAPLIIGQKVKLVLPGGPEIKGLAVAVREDALVLNVKKTSDRKAYPKGQNVIPRASMSTLQLETKHGSGGRTIGVIAGALGGLILGGDLVAHIATSEAVGISTFFGVSTGSTIAGYYLGKRYDRNVTIIRILPER